MIAGMPAGVLMGEPAGRRTRRDANTRKASSAANPMIPAPRAPPQTPAERRFARRFDRRPSAPSAGPHVPLMNRQYAHR